MHKSRKLSALLVRCYRPAEFLPISYFLALSLYYMISKPCMLA